VKFFLFIVATAVLSFAGSAPAVEKPRQGDDILIDTYYRIEAKLERNSFGLPLFLESFERDDRVNADVYGIFDYPFSSVVNVLRDPGVSGYYPQCRCRPFWNEGPQDEVRGPAPRWAQDLCPRQLCIQRQCCASIPKKVVST